jgi:hypothetical protein
MTMVPPRQPNRCAACGAEWFDTHTCPNAPRSTSVPQITDSLRIIHGDPIAAENWRLVQENDRLRWALREARDELAKWGWGDLHYGNTDQQEASVTRVMALIDGILIGPPPESDGGLADA